MTATPGLTPPETHSATPVEALDPSIDSIQPGGGTCMRIELAWGVCRRALLKSFFPGYVQKMQASRRGSPRGCPHEVLDPRDLKFYCNQGGYWWPAEHDPFAWRDRLPFARVGLCELLLISGGLALLAALTAFLYWPIAIIPAVLSLFIMSFFRNPQRTVPVDFGLVVSPADGKVVAIEELEHHDFCGGPAILIGIFLSVFNVHINRSPIAARVIGLTYRRGKFLNALRPSSARENEQMEVRLEETQAPFRRMIVRQIAGAIARRIVCRSAPGDILERGEQFGMIKVGSRTELIVPRELTMEVRVRLGQHVKAGESVLIAYDPKPAVDSKSAENPHA